MNELTLRQIEVIRAVMMTGTINGAAALLNVSAPGISRLIKHAEESLGVRLFERKAGLFIPAAEAQAVFDQIHQVYEKVENLGYAIDRLGKGGNAGLAFASVPSIAQFMAARAVRRVRRRFPDLYIDLNILKIEEAIDYLLLERSEFVAMSYALDKPTLECGRPYPEGGLDGRRSALEAAGQGRLRHCYATARPRLPPAVLRHLRLLVDQLAWGVLDGRFRRNGHRRADTGASRPPLPGRDRSGVGGRARAFAARFTPSTVVVFACFVVGCAAVLDTLAFWPVSFLLLLAVIYGLYRSAFARSVIVSLGSLFVIYAVFRVVFQVVLPEGLVPEREIMAWVDDHLAASERAAEVAR